MKSMTTEARAVMRDHGESTPDLGGVWASWAPEQLLRQNIRKGFLEAQLSTLFVTRFYETKSPLESAIR
jgi:hypothetical protein